MTGQVDVGVNETTGMVHFEIRNNEGGGRAVASFTPVEAVGLAAMLNRAAGVADPTAATEVRGYVVLTKDEAGEWDVNWDGALYKTRENAEWSAQEARERTDAQRFPEAHVGVVTVQPTVVNS